MMRYRNQYSVSVKGTDTLLIPANDRRVGFVISSPPGSGDTQSLVTLTANDTSMATTGVKLAYTCPAGRTAQHQSSTSFAVAGTTQTSQLQLVTGGNVIALSQAQTNNSISTKQQLASGDVMQWNCISAVAATTSDMTISVLELTAGGRVTLSFIGAASLDNGVTLSPGGDPFQMWYEHIGQAVREEVHAIAAAGPIVLGVLEFLELDCDCPTGQRIERRLRT